MICPYDIFKKIVEHGPKLMLIYLRLMDRDISFTLHKDHLLRLQQPSMYSHVQNAGISTMTIINKKFHHNNHKVN